MIRVDEMPTQKRKKPEAKKENKAKIKSLLGSDT